MKPINLLLITIVLISSLACQSDKSLDNGLYADFETNHGEFKAELNYKKAPMTVANFVSLAEGNNPEVAEKYKGKKFFDGLKFHRVVNGFVLQGGDPEGNGEGGPGYQFPDETDTGLTHDSKGVLSMANSGPDTNGSQFFITLSPQHKLDGKYSVFGHIVEGQDVVDSIGKVDVEGPMNTPKEDVIMEQVNIIRKGDSAKNFDAAQTFKNKMDQAEEEAQAKKEKIEQAIDTLAEDGFQETDSGLRYKITKTNDNGKKPQAGQTIKAYYKGMLKNGKVFDENKEEDGDPIEFEAGTGKVIPGWDEGLLKMREGEEARLIIPPYLGYGPEGRGPIPPNAILIFDVKLEEVE